MSKKYITPELMVIDLHEDICLNATSTPADDTPAGAKSYYIYDDIEGFDE